MLGVLLGWDVTNVTNPAEPSRVWQGFIFYQWRAKLSKKVAILDVRSVVVDGAVELHQI